MKTKTILGYALLGTTLIGVVAYAAEGTTTGSGITQEFSHPIRGKKFSQSGTRAFGSGGFMRERGCEKGEFGVGIGR
jgi:hypothetical protein